MKRKYKVEEDVGSSTSLIISPEQAAQLGIEGHPRIELLFGNIRQEVGLVQDPAQDPNTLQVSSEVCTRLRLPTTAEYYIKMQGVTLVIGPFIGILAAVKETQLENNEDYLESFIVDNAQIGGALLVFALDGVNTSTQTIQGWLFHSQHNRWEKGTFTYPAAIFSVIEVSMTDRWELFQTISDHFYQTLGPRIFNYPIFDKWEMYQWLRRRPQLQDHLPKTVIFKQSSDVKKMLKKYGRIYIKPVVGRLGAGVMEAVYDGKKVIVKTRVYDQNVIHKFPNLTKFISYLKTVTASERYLIQQAIDLLSINGRIIDFRLNLVKDGVGQWKNIGLFARYGAKRSIVSNITSGGFAEWGKSALKRSLNIKRRKANEWNQKMTALSLLAAKDLEKKGVHCANLGFDLAIDKKKKLWLIEINNQNPDHFIAVVAGRTDKFLQARQANLLYAKRLAGFPEDGT